MTCEHCGKEKLAMEYTLLCTPACRDSRTVELFLCTDCLRALCSEPDIELATEAQFPRAD